MQNLRSIFNEWQGAYCKGYPMPQWFRKEASKMWIKMYYEAKEDIQPFPVLQTPSQIYRVLGVSSLKQKPILRLDELYYSFSQNIEDVKYFCDHDGELAGPLLLIIAKPSFAVNYNHLGIKLYGKEFIETSRYTAENEIVSRLTSHTLLEVYYLNSKEDLLQYQTKGYKIKKKDVYKSLKKALKRSQE